MPSARRLACLAAGTALALAACGGDDAATGAGTEPEGPTSVARGAAAAGEVPEILRFSAPTVGGGTFDGTSYAGEPVAFWFWAPG